ncbi:MAG: hypothetical protein GWN00_15795, partial [Aliifodinibius sp.]|nr:hypothetical protein [candidate division Zixibacteria bacterium]NIT57631.1 hypothetical protein [Fodinibius sp.]NIW41042.1 hypothetical protein [candidate division Zixibacteria bacterium]NIX56504.1 hypothetical protein [candidate division Zixibacteria bacterium]NIY26213.1 hypothetical protein [Fodinibius sp.]
MRIAGLLTAICIILLGSAAAASADNSDGAITPEMIEEMQKSSNFEGPWKAIYNSLMNNDIKELALDHDKVVEHQDLFNVTIKTKGVTNQK